MAILLAIMLFNLCFLFFDILLLQLNTLRFDHRMANSLFFNTHI